MKYKNRLSTTFIFLAVIFGFMLAVPLCAQEEKAAVFSIKYLSSEAVYINAGRNAGIREDMRISVVRARLAPGQTDGARFRGDERIAELRVVSVADSSSVCEIVSSTDELEVGQIAFLTPDSVQARREVQSAAEADAYPIVIGFTYGDPLDDEIRQSEEKRKI